MIIICYLKTVMIYIKYINKTDNYSSLRYEFINRYQIIDLKLLIGIF